MLMGIDEGKTTEITFQGKLTRRDFLRAQTVHIWSRNRALIYLGAILLISFIAGSIVAPEISAFLLVPILLILIIFSAPWWLSLLLAAKGWEEGISGKVTDEGLRILSANHDTTIRWKAFISVKAREDFVLLYQFRNLYTLMLRTYFDDQEDWDQFVTLVREKVTDFQGVV